MPQQQAAKRPRLYPLDAPGLSPPGPMFREQASLYGLSLERFFEALLFGLRSDLRVLYGTSAKLAVPVVPGHPANAAGGAVRFGPRRRHRVMVVGKMLGLEEVAQRRNFVGKSGTLFYDFCRRVGLDYDDWYVTNLVKTPNPEGPNKATLPSRWIREWLPLLEQELRLVRPEILVCLGADAGKAILGRSTTVAGMEGRFEEYTFPIGRTLDDEDRHTAIVYVLPHPAAVLHVPEEGPKLLDGLHRLGRTLSGHVQVRETPDHRRVDSLEQLEALAREIEDTSEDLVAVDAEWHGDHPECPGAYLRTVQVSWKHATAACICLRGPGGTPCFRGDLDQAARLIRRICTGRRIAGHYFNADLEFLVPNRIDLRAAFSVPDTVEEYRRWWTELRLGGFDTALAAHALEETADLGLKSLAVRFTEAPRYNLALEQWRHAYCLERGLKEKDLEGFGDCPDEILVGKLKPDGRLEGSYACYDADVTRRLAVKLSELLFRDALGHDCWEPFWGTMRASAVIFEMTSNGLLVDLRRAEELTERFLLAKTKLAERIARTACWPTINLESLNEVRELLFGEALNGARREEGGPPRRLRPPGALALGLEPVLTTDKPAVTWQEYLRDRLEGAAEEKFPAANRLALAMIANRLDPADDALAARVVNDLRDYRLVSQMLKTVLRPPETLEDGRTKYTAGLLSFRCADRRIRTTIYPTLETGRWSSSRPNLQNLSKRRENDYRRILSGIEDVGYLAPVRSIVTAPPGWKLVEADYKSAELMAMAILSGDSRLREDVRRVLLPEDDPEFFDIHSHVACSAFHLDCPPTKKGLASIGKKHLRDVTKTVVYGLAYGRGAKAIAMGAEEEAIRITPQDAEAIIAAFFERYSTLKRFFNRCRARVTDPGWIANAFGRYRRFPPATDRQVLSAQERQALNFPIQSLVADVVNRAVVALHAFRRRSGIPYRIVLQIHDAVLLEVPDRHVPVVVEKVLPECLVRSVPVWQADLDGRRVSGPDAGPFYFGIDVSVMRRWGEPEEGG